MAGDSQGHTGILSGKTQLADGVVNGAAAAKFQITLGVLDGQQAAAE